MKATRRPGIERRLDQLAAAVDCLSDQTHLVGLAREAATLRRAVLEAKDIDPERKVGLAIRLGDAQRLITVLARTGTV